MSVLLLQNDWGYVLIAAELLAKLRKMTGRAAVHAQCADLVVWYESSDFEWQ